MEDRGNKTIMCSVFFLDIVGYSKKSVSGQISLKERFNSYLSDAIRDVPVSDRIILDTGDGAAINFLGDVEDALKAALSLREKLLAEDSASENPLMVRMGINLGPVRLVRDLNGQPNIVGDGINVAQRVMGFADTSQVLVSRSYYDAVSRLSPQYAGMFHYQGSRTDKHVREHEIYAIGYPGEQTSKFGLKSMGKLKNVSLGGMLKPTGRALAGATGKVGTFLGRFGGALGRFGGSSISFEHRANYLGIIGALILTMSVLLLALSVGRRQVVEVSIPFVQPEIQAEMPPMASEEPSPSSDAQQSKTGSHKLARSERKTAVGTSTTRKTTNTKSVDLNPFVSPFEAAPVGTNGFVSVTCMEGVQVFVDGSKKGVIESGTMTLQVSPGKHILILSHTSGGIYTRHIDVDAGRTIRVYKPGFCR